VISSGYCSVTVPHDRYNESTVSAKRLYIFSQTATINLSGTFLHGVGLTAHTANSFSWELQLTVTCFRVSIISEIYAGPCAITQSCAWLASFTKLLFMTLHISTHKACPTPP
jgi:hypothetical protein